MAKKKASSFPSDGDAPKKKAKKKAAASKKSVKKKGTKKKAAKKSRGALDMLKNSPALAGLRADLLVGEANDADDNETRQKLLDQALRVAPEHVPALVMAAGLQEDPLDELEMLRQAVEIAKRRLADADKKTPGEAASRTTMEYIVARGALASSEWNAGKLKAAVEGFEEVLRLDPEDGIHARWGLLSCYLLEERAEEVDELLQRFPDDDGPVWAYGAALASLRADPAAPESRRLLAEAVERHPIAGQLLLLDEDERDVRVDALLDGMLEEDAQSDEDLEPDAIFLAERCAVLLDGPWRESEEALALLAAAVLPEGAERPRSLQPLDLPPVGGETWRARLKEVPQVEDSWRFEVRRLDGWVKTKEGHSRPWLAVVWNDTEEDIRSFEVFDKAPSAETMLQLAAKAILGLRGRGAVPPGRPKAASFSDHPSHAEVAAELEHLGIARKAAGPVPPQLQEMLEALAENLVGQGPPALASVEGLSADQRKSFHLAAAEFAKEKPWKKGIWSEGIAVEAAGADGKPWKRWCIVLGHNGQEYGLGVYHDEKTLAAVAAGRLPRKVVATMVDLQPYHQLDAADYDDVTEVLGLKLEDDSWPAIVRQDGLDLLPPTPFEVETAAVCLRAAVAYFALPPEGRKQPLSVAVEYAGRTIAATVRTHLPVK